MRSLPYLADHRVRSVAVVPAATYIELALAAARRSKNASSLSELTFDDIWLLDGSRRTLQVVAAPHGEGLRIEIFSRPNETTKGSTGAPWVKHATALVNADPFAVPAKQNIEAVRARCPDRPTANDLYEILAQRGLEYGAAFRRV